MGASVFALSLLVIQLIQGTSPVFAICAFLFILIATATFNLAGGFSRPSGGYIFFYAVLVVIVGLCTKAAVGQAADSNLRVPRLDMLVYLVSITGMYCAVFVSKRLSLRKGLLQGLVAENVMLDAAIGCLITGTAIFVAVRFIPPGEGSVLSTLNQINRFLPMSIILATIYQIRKSGGTSSTNVVVWIGMGSIFSIGLIGFSKEGIFTGPVCWLIAACSQRYRLSRVQLIALPAIAFLMSTYLVPYSQYGRSFEGNPSDTAFDKAIYLLSDLSGVREKYKNSVDEAPANPFSYFGKDMGFVDRLQMIGPDDALIGLTEDREPFGLLPIYAAFANLVPRFLWPDKPTTAFNNLFAHEIGGVISDDDITTGISFSPSGEAYHLARWFGVVVVAPLIWMLLFVIFDSLCGNTLEAPWGLLVIVAFAHIAPETMLDGAIYSMVYVSFGIIVAAFASAYVMPILGSLVKGPTRTQVTLHDNIQANS